MARVKVIWQETSTFETEIEIEGREEFGQSEPESAQDVWAALEEAILDGRVDKAEAEQEVLIREISSFEKIEEE